MSIEFSTPLPIINKQIGKLTVSTTIIIKYTLFKGLVCSEWVVGTRGVIRLRSLITASKPLYDVSLAKKCEQES